MTSQLWWDCGANTRHGMLPKAFALMTRLKPSQMSLFGAS